MFFMMSITDGRKDFDFHQQIICDLCGRYGRFEVFMTILPLPCFLSRALSGTSAIMCRQAAVGPCMNLIRRSEKGSQGEKT